MKKISVFLLVSLIFVGITYGVLSAINNFYDNKISNIYEDYMGDKLLNEKNQGLVMQRQSINREDNVQVFGSSELSSNQVPTHPSNFFANKLRGFQVNLIGRGHSQSITHTINMGALSQELKGKKVVFILSPQWFTEEGLSPEAFESNFSELQFYSLMFNKNIKDDLKTRLAKRVSSLTKSSSSYGAVYQYASMYTKDNLFSKTGIALMTPYSKLKFYILSIRDKVQTYNVIKDLTNTKDSSSANITKQLNWEEQLVTAEELGKQSSSNNEFGIQNEYYDTYIKERLASLKGSYRGQSYLSSPEYEDLKLLLDLCKSQDIKPLFVSVPVHGKWYDYSEFPKADRDKYYEKVNSLIKSYGFETLDLSQHEYEQYFLKDIMHLGWKGWIYIDKAIDQYYNKY